MCHFTEQMVELLSTQTTDKTQSHFETITNPADHIKKNDRNPLANKRVSLKQTHLKCHSDCFKQNPRTCMMSRHSDHVLRLVVFKDISFSFYE